MPDVPVNLSLVQTLPVAAINPGGTNPRKTFDRAALLELTESVRTHGVLQPILVRLWPGGLQKPSKDTLYELVAGERRWRAALAAGLEEIPALIRRLDDAAVLEIQVIENLQRADLHPLEEAAGYERLLRLELGGGYNVARIAERVGRSASYVYDRLRLLRLTPEAQELFRSGQITAGHAIILSRLRVDDQARACSDSREGGLWQNQAFLLPPSVDPSGTDVPAELFRKPRSVRELQDWVDRTVKLDLEDDAAPMLFPDTVETLKQSKVVEEKVVQITHEYHVQATARDGSRILGPRSWKRATAKPCSYEVIGVVVVGAERGLSFRVCTAKKECKVHWGAEIRAAKGSEKAALNRKAAEESPWVRMERERKERHEKEEAERKVFRAALPGVLVIVASSVRSMAAGPKGALAKLILSNAPPTDRSIPAVGEAHALVPLGESPEDVVRRLAWLWVVSEAGQWDAPVQFPRLLKSLGIDMKKARAASAADLEAKLEASKPKAKSKKAASGR